MIIKIKQPYTPKQNQRIRVHVFNSEEYVGHLRLGKLYSLHPQDGDEVYQQTKDIKESYASI